MPSQPNDTDLRSSLRKQRVFTVRKLVQLMGCSVVTGRRRLRDWQAHTSYNASGKFYVLPDVPEFNKDGIWECRGALFSKHGNLKETLKFLVDTSTAGLSTIELGEWLRLPPHTIQSILSASWEQIEVTRRQFNGLNIYFSDQSTARQAQERERERLLAQSSERDLPSDSDAVVILVELIKHPDDSIKRIVQRVRRRGVSVPIEKARNLLAHHGIRKKKADSSL